MNLFHLNSKQFGMFGKPGENYFLLF